MDYAFIKNNIVVNVAVFESDLDANNFKEHVPEIDNIVKLEDGYGIGDKYEDGLWIKREIDINADITLLKTEKILQSKQQLAEFLENNPLLYNNELYSVTQEKQSLLTSAIAAYQLKVQANVPAVLKWNTTGDICREFTLEEITGLVVAITEYVQPRVEKQQALEVTINNCTTIEELDNIVIDYEVV